MRDEPTVPDLLARIRRDDGELGAPAAPAAIGALESALGVTLPADYRDLLAAASWVRHRDLIVCGIAPDDPGLDARTRTLAHRQTMGLWAGLVRISDDGGDYGQFLVADPTDESYGSVVALPEGVRHVTRAILLDDGLLTFMQYALDP